MYSFKKKPKAFFQKKQSDNRKTYDSAAWRGPNGLRKNRLFIEPFCRSCGNPGSLVDHINPINQGGDAFDFQNTQTLCDSCHNKKRNKEKYEYGK